MLKVEIATAQKAKYIKLKRIWSTIEYPRQFQYPRECCLLEHLLSAKIAVHSVGSARSGSAPRCCWSWRCHRPGSCQAPCSTVKAQHSSVGMRVYFFKFAQASPCKNLCSAGLKAAFFVWGKILLKTKRPGVFIAEVSCWLEET